MPQSYADIIQELESKGMMPDRPPSLEPMKEGLSKILSVGEIDPLKVIVVAGTNGKGSVCATLEALLLAAGKKVGLYTSPHLEESTERIRVNGQDISRDQFCESYSYVISKTADQSLSHFEILTLMAAWAFFGRSSVDYAIFEVGLGGTWDATNAIPHKNCAITALGYDHQNLLGNTIQEIASNKFGIVNSGTTVVHSPLPVEVEDLAREVQQNTASTWILAKPFPWRVEYRNWEPLFIIQTPWGESTLNLPGARAVENTTTALKLFQTLGFDPTAFLSALPTLRWPGRMEKYQVPQAQCSIYLSGDHNVNGVASLLEVLKHYPRKHLYILAGTVKDKDLDAIMPLLAKIPDASLYLTEVSFRTRLLEEYGQWLTQAQGAWKSPKEALNHLISLASAEDLILVTGSLYLVGEMRTYLKETERRKTS